LNDGVRIGIDIGGTFVDVVAQSREQRQVAKLLSDPDDPLRAFGRALDQVLDTWGIDADAIVSLRHGSTIAVNTVLERTGATVGLLTTAGFRDALELGRQRRQDLYTLAVAPATPIFLAPRARRLEISERIGAGGDVVQPMVMDAAAEAIHKLAEDGIDALAVCLLFAHINPVHERRLAELARALYPQLPVSLSHIVNPLFREYERTAATCFDAYLKPRVGAYLDAAAELVRARGISAPLQVMDSIGGVRSVQGLKATPLKLLLSGPAAAVTGAGTVMLDDAASTLITVDIGGTSADVGVISEGRVSTREEGLIDGFSIRVPTVDVTAIGAGGGSIAWLDDGGGLQVGPKSAGAVPGPACYGGGNSQPTLTDASVVLGYLTPEMFARQDIKIDPSLAHAAVLERLAAPLGISVAEAALGMHRVANVMMAETIRKVALERGADPRGLTLVPLGGAGGLHAAALAETLQVRRVAVPLAPGVMAADGVLSAPLKLAAVHTLMRPIRQLTQSDLAAVFLQLDEELDVALRLEGPQTDAFEILDEAIVAFAGQSHTLTVIVPAGSEPGMLARAAKAQHEYVHGHAPAAEVVLHALRRTRTSVSAHLTSGVAHRTPIASPRSSSSNVWRCVRFAVDVPAVETRCVPRFELEIDRPVSGPLVVEQLDSTLLVPPGWQLRNRADYTLEMTVELADERS
jgi:N-methylhydantoinase A/oxoprolinase/acetone carboxylase beta subunit